MRCGCRWPVTLTAPRCSAARGRTRRVRAGAGAATLRRPAGSPGRYRLPMGPRRVRRGPARCGNRPLTVRVLSRSPGSPLMLSAPLPAPLPARGGLGRSCGQVTDRCGQLPRGLKPNQRHDSGERQGQGQPWGPTAVTATRSTRDPMSRSHQGRPVGSLAPRKAEGQSGAGPLVGKDRRLPTPDNIPVRDVTSSHARRSSGPRRPRTGGWSREGARNRPPRAARQPGCRQMHLRPRPPTTVP